MECLGYGVPYPSLLVSPYVRLRSFVQTRPSTPAMRPSSRRVGSLPGRGGLEAQRGGSEQCEPVRTEALKKESKRSIGPE